MYAPDEYATQDVFLRNPEKAWQLYRAMGKILVGKKPNPAHDSLAFLEQKRMLWGVVTQNVDNLHQAAGSEEVFEIHGDHQHLQCIRCGDVQKLVDEFICMEEVPLCTHCDFPLKPNVVLFGESVRHLQRIEELMQSCDLLLVAGTSAQVYPAAAFPVQVKKQGGVLYEFNLEQTVLSSSSIGSPSLTDYFFQGDVCKTLPQFVQALCRL